MYAAVVGLGFSNSEKVGTFAEMYSTRGPSGDWDQASLQSGLTYLLTPSLQLDGHAGVRLKDAGEGYYLGLGFSRRF